MRKRWKRIVSFAMAVWLLAGLEIQAGSVTQIIDQMMGETVESKEPEEETDENKSVSYIPYYEKGDVVGFIGDSITHVEYSSINYVEFLYQYYLSHFPDEEVEFRNLGVASYKASDILDIYDRDKAFRGLDKALILLGMNEGLKKIPTETYIANMEKLVGKLKADGLKGPDIIVFSPTPYDETCNANFDKKGNPYRKTDTNYLSDYTKALEEKTKEWGVRYVDLHTPMLELTEEIQKDDKNRTLTIWDCVHPDALGQMVMAYELLQKNGAEAVISEIAIPAEGEAQAVNAAVTDLYRGEKGLSWTLKAEKLPMAMTEEYEAFVEQLFDLVSELNQMPLQIAGLKEAVSYTVTMGGESLGAFTGKELAEGINLAVLENNPLQKAMMEAEMLNQQWHPNSAEYRKIVRFATMATPTHTMEQMEEAYKSWKNTDLMLRDGMYEIVQSAVKKSYEMTVTEEGYTIDELHADKAAYEQALLEAEQAAKAAEEAAKQAEREAAKAELEALLGNENGQAGVSSFVIISVIGVVLCGLIAAGLWFWFAKKK